MYLYRDDMPALDRKHDFQPHVPYYGTYRAPVLPDRAFAPDPLSQRYYARMGSIFQREQDERLIRSCSARATPRCRPSTASHRRSRP